MNAHGKSSSNLDYVRETALAVIDLVRVSFLTLAIAQYPRLVRAEFAPESLDNFALFLGIFLLLNFVWNLVAQPLELSIEKIFSLRLEQIRADGRKVERAVGEATKALLGVNRLAFFFFFPLVAALVLVAYTLGRLVSPEAGDVGILSSVLTTHFVGVFIFFLSIQIVLKLTQIGVIRVVLSIDSSYREPSESPPESPLPGLISQMSSAAKYSVFVVNPKSLTLQQTNYQLEDLMTARTRLYFSDKRRKYLDVAHLAFDPRWDQVSAHIVHLEHDQIVGMIRVTPSIDRQLPISGVFPELKFREPCFELSRMIVDDKYRTDGGKGSLIAMRLFVGCASYLNPRAPQSIVIDAIVETECVIKERTYARMGFASQDHQYRDQRYGAASVVLEAADATAVARFMT